MAYYNFFNLIFGFGNFHGTQGHDLIFGLFGDNKIDAKDGDDVVFSFFGDDTISGGNGDDALFAGFGDDVVVGNKGNDFMFGGYGNDLLVWNNGDGSDFIDGGQGYDIQQVNFDTDLVNNDLQNDDVAQFAVTDKGIEFARIEVNGQSEFGLFQLDIRKTEVQETNFGGGDDTAVITGDVLNAITLDLDGGDGVDTLDFSDAAGPVSVDLATGVIEIDNGAGQDASAINFENIIGTDSDDILTGDAQDNIIRGGSGNDIMSGGEGADTFLFLEQDEGVKVILDFEVGIDQLAFLTTDPDVTTENLLANLSQTGDDVELTLNNKTLVFEDTLVTDFAADDFMIA